MVQIIGGMITPGDADGGDARVARHLYIVDRVADHHRCLRCGAGLGHGAAEHFRVRLAGGAVGGLLGDKTLGQAVAGEDGGQATVALARGDAKEDAGGLDGVEGGDGAGVEGFVGARGVGIVEDLAVGVGEAGAEAGVGLGRQAVDGVGQGQADDGAGGGGGRRLQAGGAPGGVHGGVDAALAVDQGAVAIEYGEAKGDLPLLLVQTLKSFIRPLGLIPVGVSRVVGSLVKIFSGHAPSANVVGELRGTELQQAVDELYVEAAGYYALPYVPDQYALDFPEEDRVGEGNETLAPLTYFNFRKASIYGGSNEIQKNIVAKHVLGL